MYKVNKSINFLLVLLLSAAGNLNAQTNELEIMTLLTTQQERELINRNRYEKQQITTDVVITEEPQQEHGPEKEVEQQEIILTLKLDGVAISKSGPNIAWINGKPYENGDELESGIKVYINAKNKTQVKIKTPDGKYHVVVAGEMIDISYFKRIEG